MDENPPSRDDEVAAEGQDMARADMRRVGQAKRDLRKARDEFKAAIRAAVASGETYRDVARMAGISHQRIHQVVHEDSDDE
jgi:DNA invertase Pin-like site-specific DNA recombinase